jgi:uncharacterized DUF497 family protein
MAGAPSLAFDWDTSNVRDLAGHNITPLEFEQAMTHDPIVIDFSTETGEERWYALGATNRLRVLFMVFTYREERIRPVTGWDANRKSRKLYFQKKGE